MADKKKKNLNLAGLSKSDYRGAPTTLCAGCGHNSISSQIVAACYELNIVPENLVKFSGIGCSSKSPTYFLNRTFGFNSLHGRMPSVATGAMFGDITLQALGVSGDGDSTNIGLGQFKHAIRRNLPMVYIVENNGVYGLTKGQFSATAEEGLTLKYHGTNPFEPVDVAMEAMVSSATFVARSFAGDAKQVKTLLKAALSHNGIAVLDIISPCVTFNNRADSHHSYDWSREHQELLHDLSYVPIREEITIDEFPAGTVVKVDMHDGSHLLLKKLEEDYDPTSRADAYRVLEESQREGALITGLIYLDTERPTMKDIYNLPDEPLNRVPEEKLRPAEETLVEVNAMMF